MNDETVEQGTVEQNSGGDVNKVVNKRKRLSKKERKELKRLKKSKAVTSQPKKESDAVTSVDFLEKYVPITSISSSEENERNGDYENGDCSTKKKTSLGSWFPSAKLVKVSTGLSSNQDTVARKSCSLVLFYQYVTPQWSQTKVDRLVQLLVYIGKKRKLGGRIRVAKEGINATVSSLDAGYGVRYLSEDLKRFDEKGFEETDFKFIDGLSGDRHFKDLKVYPVQEIVYYGIKDNEAPIESKGGIHLDPVEYHEKLKESNTVVIDVRNHYEAAIGRFDRQESNSKDDIKGAEYVDPMMRRSTDFPDWLAKEETRNKLEGKQVLMYCTGGVRCEKASAYLQSKIGDKVNGVFQLKGGIEKYFKQFPDGGFWRGKNFVFDKREAVSVSNLDGDGGVVRKVKKGRKDKNDKDSIADAKCCACDKKWDRYVGKKKCYTCAVPILLCQRCMSLKLDKNDDPAVRLKTRCPLCVKENITKPSFEVTGTRGN